MKRLLITAIAALLALSALTFVADYSVLRYRIATNRNPYGSVTVYVYYSVAEKNNKTEFLSSHKENDTCVHSLFPHMGLPPCWYLTRHTEQRIEM
jgi:hypothetical protein